MGEGEGEEGRVAEDEGEEEGVAEGEDKEGEMDGEAELFVEASATGAAGGKASGSPSSGSASTREPCSPDSGGGQKTAPARAKIMAPANSSPMRCAPLVTRAPLSPSMSLSTKPAISPRHRLDPLPQRTPPVGRRGSGSTSRTGFG